MGFFNILIFLNFKNIFFFKSIIQYFFYYYFFFFSGLNIFNLIYFNNSNIKCINIWYNLSYLSYFYFKKNNINRQAQYNLKNLKKINFYFFEKYNFKKLYLSKFNNNTLSKNWFNYYNFNFFFNNHLDYFFKNYNLLLKKKFKLKKLFKLKHKSNNFLFNKFNVYRLSLFLIFSHKVVFYKLAEIHKIPSRDLFILRYPMMSSKNCRILYNIFIFNYFNFFKFYIYVNKQLLRFFNKNYLSKIYNFKKLNNVVDINFFWFFFLNFFSLKFYNFFFKNYNLNNHFNKFNTNSLIRNNALLESIYFRIYNSKVPNYFFFLNFFFKNFFENFFKQKIQLNFIFLKNLIKKLKKKLFFKFMLLKFRKYQVGIGKGFFLEETLEVIWLTFLLKDSFFFLNWLNKTMGRIYFKSHKRFLNFLKFIFTKIFTKILWYFNCSGFYFLVKGKIGVTGNAKKRKFSFFSKHFSLTTKKNKLSFYKNSITTHTGALGVKFFIVFN